MHDVLAATGRSEGKAAEAMRRHVVGLSAALTVTALIPIAVVSADIGARHAPLTQVAPSIAPTRTPPATQPPNGGAPQSQPGPGGALLPDDCESALLRVDPHRGTPIGACIEHVQR